MRPIKAGRPLIDLVKLCFDAKRPAILIGKHGIGKSELLKAAAAEMKVIFISRDLSLMEPPDLIGLPRPEGDVTRYLRPAFLPTDGQGLLVFEELNRCPTYMRAPCLQLLTERTLNDYRLPDDWLPMAAINPPDESYEVQDLDPALLSRFVQIRVVPDLQEWLIWAKKSGVHEAVIDYVSAHPKSFNDPQSNPRSWKYVSDLVIAATAQGTAKNRILQVAVAGVVGEKVATDFLRSVKLNASPILSPENILTNYGKLRPQMRNVIQNRQSKVAATALLDMEKWLQQKSRFEDVKSDAPQLLNLVAFIQDLPGELKKKAKKFFDERGYAIPA
jgi:MoxR-like ATPase